MTAIQKENDYFYTQILGVLKVAMRLNIFEMYKMKNSPIAKLVIMAPRLCGNSNFYKESIKNGLIFITDLKTPVYNPSVHTHDRKRLEPFFQFEHESANEYKDEIMDVLEFAMLRNYQRKSWQVNGMNLSKLSKRYAVLMDKMHSVDNKKILLQNVINKKNKKGWWWP